MKKFSLSFITLLVSSLTLTGCIQDNSSITSSIDNSSSSTGGSEDKNKGFTIFSINDIHGHIDYEDSYYGAVQLLANITHDSDYDENSIIIGSGDMYQGTALSNESKGKTMADVLSYFPIVSSTVGNHEFDWGMDALKEITEYASYPTLGCNVFDKNGNKVDFLDDYTIVENDVAKIGIIGAIGQLENSISQVSLDGTYFDTDISIISNLVDELKVKGCDPIIVSVHNGASNWYTQEIAELPDVDGIFAGHTHSFDNNVIFNTPVVQGGCNSNGYSKITFKYVEGEYNKEATTPWYVDLLNDGIIYSSDINNDLNNYIESIDRSFIDRVIGTTEVYLGRSDYGPSLGLLTLQAMYDTYLELHPEDRDKNIAVIHNTGGIRSSIYEGEITYGDVYQVFPFDNRVVVTEVPVNNALQEVKNSSNFGRYFKNDSSSDSCLVITIDYLTTNPNYPNIYDPINGGQDIKLDGTSYYIRDLMADYITDTLGGRITSESFHLE